jgi:hypothetical protein
VRDPTTSLLTSVGSRKSLTQPTIQKSAAPYTCIPGRHRDRRERRRSWAFPAFERGKIPDTAAFASVPGKQWRGRCCSPPHSPAFPDGTATGGSAANPGPFPRLGGERSRIQPLSRLFRESGGGGGVRRGRRAAGTNKLCGLSFRQPPHPMSSSGVLALGLVPKVPRTQSSTRSTAHECGTALPRRQQPSQRTRVARWVLGASPRMTFGRVSTHNKRSVARYKPSPRNLPVRSLETKVGRSRSLSAFCDL